MTWCAIRDRDANLLQVRIQAFTMDLNIAANGVEIESVCAGMTRGKTSLRRFLPRIVLVYLKESNVAYNFIVGTALEQALGLHARRFHAFRIHETEIPSMLVLQRGAAVRIQHVPFVQHRLY